MDWSDKRQATAWIIGERAAHIEAARTAARAAGLRIADPVSIEAALAAVARRPSDSVAIVDVGDLATPNVEALLELLDAQAHDARMPVVVRCCRDTVNLAAARIAAPYARLVCDGFSGDLAAALIWSQSRLGGVSERDRPIDAIRLQQLTDEVARIARALADLSDPMSPAAVSEGIVGYRAQPGAKVSTEIASSTIRDMLRWRRRRDQLFAGDLFADPAWDMMLDLAAARLEGVDVAVSSLCIAAVVPATTALRWIKTLTDVGLFVRVADPNDRRRVFIALSESTAANLLAFLSDAQAAGDLL